MLAAYITYVNGDIRIANAGVVAIRQFYSEDMLLDQRIFILPQQSVMRMVTSKDELVKTYNQDNREHEWIFPNSIGKAWGISGIEESVNILDPYPGLYEMVADATGGTYIPIDSYLRHMLEASATDFPRIDAVLRDVLKRRLNGPQMIDELDKRFTDLGINVSGGRT